MVFLTRYLDILFGWRSLYVLIMKVIFISITSYTIYLMRRKKPYNLSYDRESDSLPHYFLYLGALVLAIIIHKSLHPLEFIWSFSVWLEAFAILPQLYMINKLRDIENITAHYVFFLGLYRVFYIAHWYYSHHSGYSIGRLLSSLHSLLAFYRVYSMPISYTISSAPTKMHPS